LKEGPKENKKKTARRKEELIPSRFASTKDEKTNHLGKVTRAAPKKKTGTSGERGEKSATDELY